PAPLYYVGLALFLGGALGLVLTQGRESKNPIARLMTGLVSLYGIVGSYGITAFIGDTMSYCRLLALGLTTSIVAMSFNMIANLLRPVPYAGIFLFVGALLIGHIFNFFISVMGAFVHSMRLILVEFFGRFYEGGAKPFTPLGFDSEAAILRKSESRSA
ncbi:MAG TPA: V-type ATP synthase subunit I, partial [Candidatus Hydrogenedentes bacterium]|nr:V-type ATP synthase subunit I [Candidatus Hydrogenedentota bacterium]